MKLQLLSGLAAAVVLAAFSGNIAHAVEPEIVSRGTVALEDGSGCTADATKALIRKFVRDYAKGRVATINRLWAPEPRFQWFSTSGAGARIGPPAYDRATLAVYFRARARLHERIRVTELRAGYDPKRNIVNFSGKLVRSADDLPRRPPQDFKGAADCDSGHPSLIVWSM